MPKVTSAFYYSATMQRPNGLKDITCAIGPIGLCMRTDRLTSKLNFKK